MSGFGVALFLCALYVCTNVSNNKLQFEEFQSLQ